MSHPRLNRRGFLAATAGLAALPAQAGAADAAEIPDTGWRLWVDEAAPWQDDAIFLPEDVVLGSLPANPPTGGWERLTPDAGIAVTLPATVEQHHWGRFGRRPYTLDEYAWAPRDPMPQNGAYRGVSWWWRPVAIPAEFSGRRILLTVPGARLRAEVYLNRELVGYSILEELPFTCDLTEAANPGGENLLAIRITNPGGRYDWLDGAPMAWGQVRLQRSHGFGGLDHGLSLGAHPIAGHIADLWVLNTPEPRTVQAFVRVEGAAVAPPVLALQQANGGAVAAKIAFAGLSGEGAFKYIITARKARLWSLERPNLHRLTARWQAPGGGVSTRQVTFGFRWFAPEGVGRDARFQLNGKRIKLYSAISWGYWGLNGLWPTPDLAEKEVRQARALGLNCLAFHRNVGREAVLAAHDRLGLLRTMEPGGGKFALGALPDGTKLDAPSVVMTPPNAAADRFAQRYMLAKCAAMVRAFRSHPSLIQYTLQNEVGADFADPATLAALDAMRAEDESRCIVLNDGFVGAGDAPYMGAAQAWYAPYDPALHRSDREPWGGWWNAHQGAGDQWLDEFYRGPRVFNYRRTLRTPIVQFGEMEACAAPDNHALAVADIQQRGGSAYDLEDHRQIDAAYDAFLDRWGFRKAFPATDRLYRAIGRRSYESWRQYMENIRISDPVDAAAISGWESTAIENHAGLVDNLRNFKSDPAIIAASLQPIRPIAKQRRLVVATGEAALFDLYLANDSSTALAGELTLAMTDPKGRRQIIGKFRAPPQAPDRFCALIAEAVASPKLALEGAHRFSLSLPGHPADERDIWVCDPGLAPVGGRTLRIGAAAPQALHDRLKAIQGVAVEEFSAGGSYDSIVAAAPLTPPLLAAVRGGTPLLVMAQDDALADALATQLAAEGAFTYRGQVGRLRAPWMGSWHFMRPHPAYDGMPPDPAMGLYHQIPGRTANGLLVDGPGVEVFAGYGRDHDRQIGAATFTAMLGKGKMLFQRVPDLNGPLQQRFLRNALAWLCT